MTPTLSLSAIIASSNNKVPDEVREACPVPEEEDSGNQPAEASAKSAKTWQGFAFNVGRMPLVVSFADGVEIMPVGELSPVPLARDWVGGMKNIHGEIHTVVDFAAFLGLPPTLVDKTCNLFVLPDTALKSALLIAGRIDLRSFPSALPAGDCGPFRMNLLPYLSAVVVDRGQHRGIVDVGALCECSNFVQIELSQK